MHTLIEEPSCAPPAVVWNEATSGQQIDRTKNKYRTTTDHANADQQWKKWKKIWKGNDSNKGIQQAREIMKHDSAGDIQWPGKDEINRYRVAAKAFPKHTAMSDEAFKPHFVFELSDGAIAHLIWPFKKVKKKGRWPEQWRTPLLYFTLLIGSCISDLGNGSRA